MSADDAGERRGLLKAFVGDGRPLLTAGAGGLVLAGGFCLLLALSGEFLPHDIRYLGMSAADLCSYRDCRVVRFMMHDRAAFGGALVAVGLLYAYLVRFPLGRGEPWAWWLLCVSAGLGFLSFLGYLGYGYLDTWHGVGTLLLLPLFAGGLARSRHLVRRPAGEPTTGESNGTGLLAGAVRAVLAGRFPRLTTPEGLGRACLLVGAGGVALAGLEILRVGVTDVFVPEDLMFMDVSADQLRSLNSRLVPLIAHDRAGFGGAVFTTGFTTLGCVWFARMTRALWETLLIAGTVSLTAAIGIHLVVGYVNAWHLAPAVLGAGSLLAGLALTFRSAYGRRNGPDPEPRDPEPPEPSRSRWGTGAGQVG